MGLLGIFPWDLGTCTPFPGPTVLQINACMRTGKAAAGTSATATKKDVLGRQDEDMELLEDIHKNAQADKQRAPLFDRQAYYPTVVPFVPVDVPHDPNAIMHDTGVPPDLAEQVQHCKCF